jgi:hypothetical protein
MSGAGEPAGDERMANIVMLASAWHGGWALTPIARKLRAHGHDIVLVAPDELVSIVLGLKEVR